MILGFSRDLKGGVRADAPLDRFLEQSSLDITGFPRKFNRFFSY